MPKTPVMYVVIAKHRKKRDALRNVTYVTERVEVVKECDLDKYPGLEGWSTVSSPLTLQKARRERKSYARSWLNK